MYLSLHTKQFVPNIYYNHVQTRTRNIHHNVQFFTSQKNINAQIYYNLQNQTSRVSYNTINTSFQNRNFTLLRTKSQILN